MKKFFLCLAASMLALVLCVSTASAYTTNNAGEVMVRVGIASSSSGSKIEELIGANLWNNTGYGAGYRFGYYDEDLDFVELARTSPDMEQVSVIKTQNTWFRGNDRNSFRNEDNGGTYVGCYHLQLPGSYLSYEEAEADASLYGGFVAWINGVYRVRVGSYLERSGAEQALAAIPNSSIAGTSTYGMNVIETGTSNILFQYDMGAGTKLAVLPDVTGAEDVRTWFYDIKYRGGFTYQRIDGGDLTVVNVVELEDYVKGVAPYEMGRSWPLEALKTQATCARTYAMRRIGRHGSLGFDVCPSDHCQVYNGVGSKSTTWGPTPVSDRAVEETAGQVLWYQDKLAETVYSSSHGGASEDAKYIWGTDTTIQHPYLCGVVDPYEKLADDINPRSSWTVTYSSRELTQRLNEKGFGMGTSVDHMDLTYSDLGNVIRLEVYWTNGQKNTFKPSDGRSSIRSVFGVNSIRFTVNDAGTAPEPEAPPVSFWVNRTEKLMSLADRFVLGGDGTARKAGEELYTITGDGAIIKLDQGGGQSEPAQPSKPGENKAGRVTVSGDTYVFRGSGWGHSVGMSQFGAYAMAEEGYTYDQICQFYFPGTHVGPIRK